MNHEFEWRNQLRKLGGAVEPQRDLWPAIAAAVATSEATAQPRRRPMLAWLALAATVIVAVGAATFAWRSPSGRIAPAPELARQAPPSVAPAAVAERPSTALDWAVPQDPALAASAQNLDNASAQLQSALEQRPDAVFLVGLLNRTNAQRLRLMRKSPYSG